MKQIMIATSNAHKVEEFKRMLQPYGYEENALIKAKTIYDKLHIEVIADDSGLAVNAMNGEPGIYSARFLGRDTSYDVKNQYIIDQVKDAQDKGAQFVCAIAYIDADGHENVFTGVVEGEIYDHIEGAKGFGYDPIFYYQPFKTTLANVSEDQKNEVSHRGKAIQMLLNYMKEGK